MWSADEFDRVSRRQLIRGAAAAGAAILLGPARRATSQSTPPSPASASRKRVLRLAHLTDVHVQPERRAGEGLAACLRHVSAQKDRPQLILTGGDSIMDSFEADEARTKLQWELWKKVLADETDIPIESCIGNHDIWGWNKTSSRTTGEEAKWGKKWALEMFGVEKPYRSFVRAGWRFVVLDSTHPDGDGYTAKLDDEQFEWLKGDLAAADPKKPVLVLSHIPIVSATAFFAASEKSGDWKVPGSYMHIDARRIKDLFLRHANVKLCLSGHIHLVDRVDYLGVTYLCNGAVSGAWWKGKNQECEEGYALVDLYDDGTFDERYVTYGWKA